MHTGKNCTLAQAMALVHSGDRVMIGGFGDAGLPDVLVEALADSGLRDHHFLRPRQRTRARARPPAV